jgi:DNA-directed RNA polymerase subunit M/transcription elongation factor TFIIS
MNYGTPVLAQVDNFEFLRRLFPKKSADQKDTVSKIELNTTGVQSPALSDDEIKELLKIKIGNKTLLSNSNPGIVYDVMSMIRLLGITETISNLNKLVSSGTFNESNFDRFLFFETKSFEKEQVNFSKDLIKMQQQPEPVKGLVPCPRCRSKNTVISYLQTRSSDEGYTFIIICNNCGARSHL